MSDTDDLIKDFLVESYENLDQLDRDFVELENNPTDRSISREEFGSLSAMARREGLAIVSDEVFLDLRLTDRPGEVRVAAAQAADTPALTFSLGGVSKAAALPQLKLGWIASGGPSSELGEALARL